jgi:ABC-2 type transport system ATP-binding protein
VDAPHEGTTVFFSSHQLAEVERIADDILMIDQGRSVLDMPLEQIRENYRRVTFGFAGHPPALPSNFDGIERTRMNGRQIIILASRNTEAIAQLGHERNAVDIDVSPIGLREIFLETVQQQDHLGQQEHHDVLV